MYLRVCEFALSVPFRPRARRHVVLQPSRLLFDVYSSPFLPFWLSICRGFCQMLPPLALSQVSALITHACPFRRSKKALELCCVIEDEITTRPDGVRRNVDDKIVKPTSINHASVVSFCCCHVFGCCLDTGMCRTAPEALICDHQTCHSLWFAVCSDPECDVDVLQALVPLATVVHIPIHPRRAMCRCGFHFSPSMSSSPSSLLSSTLHGATFCVKKAARNCLKSSPINHSFRLLPDRNTSSWSSSTFVVCSAHSGTNASVCRSASSRFAYPFASGCKTLTIDERIVRFEVRSPQPATEEMCVPCWFSGDALAPSESLLAQFVGRGRQSPPFPHLSRAEGPYVVLSFP